MSKGTGFWLRALTMAFLNLVFLFAVIIQSYEPARCLLLRIPKYGFMLYGIAGGPIPPFFNPEIYSAEDQWGRKGDVFVVSGGKSGSTWVSNIVHEIRTKGNPKPFRDLYEEVRIPEFVYYPGQPLEERAALLRDSLKDFPFAVFKTHQTPPAIHVRPDAKYILIVRNLHQTVASSKTFLESHSKQFAKMWGGFPMQAGQESSFTVTDYEHYVLKDIGSGRGQLDIYMLDFIRAWWPYRNSNNALFLHYSDLVKDLAGSVEKIAKFLGIGLSEDDLKKITDHTSFEDMKSKSEKFNIEHVYDEYIKRGLVPNNMRLFVGDLIMKGPSRKPQMDLSERLMRGIEEHCKRDLGEKIAEWVMNGGRLPVESELPPKFH